MKNLFMVLALVAANAQADYGFKKEPFSKVIYLGAVTATQSALNSGEDANAPLGLVDGDLWVIPAGAVVENVYMIVDTPIVGLTSLVVGDDDSSNGFITNSISLNAGAGIQYYEIGWKGSYLRASAIGDLQSVVQRKAKYYSASGKEIKLDVTGTASAGAARLVIEGYKL